MNDSTKATKGRIADASAKRWEDLTETYDFHALADKYRLVNWRWGGSYNKRGFIPDAEQIRAAVYELLTHAEKSNSKQEVTSGGLYARYDGMRYYLRVDRALGGTADMSDTDGE